MTKVYFVRHAQPEHAWKEDRTRPLTEDGKRNKLWQEMLSDIFIYRIRSKVL